MVGSALSELERESDPSASPPTPGWAERLVRALDDGIRVPGTSIRFGLDPIIGLLLPGAGDAVSGAGSVALLVLALRERVPTVVLLRMVFHILVDTLGGSIPLVGDVFDFFFKSNRKNLELIERHRRNPEGKPGVVDYLVVGMALVLVALAMVLPLMLGAVLGVWLASEMASGP
jgi:hypothetical protein